MADNTYTIGIAGHRKLPSGCHEALTEEIRSFYRDKAAKYGKDNLTVLSSLAEGADTLCARLALDMDLRLVVPLPMNALEYRRSFPDRAAAEYDCLLSLADQVFVVSPEEPVPPDPGRGFYYRQAGIYVAKHCDALLAVWDGEKRDTADGAGTWETIKLSQMYRKPVYVTTH